MAESFGDGAAAELLLSQKKSKLGGEPGEGEDPLKGLVSTSADPDLDISASGSKSAQASNPDLFSSIEFEEGDKKDDQNDYDQELEGEKQFVKMQRPFPRHCLTYVCQKKRKLEGEPGEGEDPLKGLVKPSTSADPDLDISASASKSAQASNPDWFSSIDFEEGDKKDDHNDYDQELEGRKLFVEDRFPRRAVPLQASVAFLDPHYPLSYVRQKKRKVEGEPGEGQDPLKGLIKPSTSVDPDLKISTSSTKSTQASKLGEPEGEDVQGLVKTRAPGFSIDHILDMETAKRGEPKRKTRSCLRSLQKKLKSLVSTQASNTISGELLPLKEEEEQDYTEADTDTEAEAEDEDEDEDADADADADEDADADADADAEEDEDEDAEGWWRRMSEERVSVWFYRWRPRYLDYERPKSPGWGYSDVDKNDPLWHDKFVEEIRRDTPLKYRLAALEKEAYCPPGVEKKDEALWERYLKQIKESDGYDITDFPGITMITPITPMIGFKQCPSEAERFSRFTDAAISEFNSTREENDQYEVHDILTVNVRSINLSTLHFITFEAKKKNKNSNASAAAKEEDDHGGAPLLTTFQARVLAKIIHSKDKVEVEVKVEECRIKALKPSPARASPH